MAPVDVVLRFVAAINAHDLADVAGLMTGDHRLIDSLGAVVSGGAKLREGWQALPEPKSPDRAYPWAGPWRLRAGMA
jgi:ketosteroid isomerase-like protein